MSITMSSLRFALTTAALCAAAATADARARRVVVLDFDGPRQFADVGKSQVVTVLGAQYEVVDTRRWETARAAASRNSHGPKQWSKAAKQSGVDAVIEGWVQDEGRHKVLSVVVRQASNGREFDTITVRLDGRAAMSTEVSRKLATQLDELLDWIDPGIGDPAPALPVVRVNHPAAGSRQTPARQAVANDDDSASGARGRRSGDDDDAAPRTRRGNGEDGAGAGPRSRRGNGEDEAGPRSRRSNGEDEAPRSRRGSVDDDAGEPAPPRRTRQAAAEPDDAGEPPASADEQHEDSQAPGATPPREAAPDQVSSIADREAREIEILFPQNSVERKQILGDKADRAPVPTPRFMVDAGAYLHSRTLTWTGDPEGAIPQFAGVSSRGLAVNAAVYPFPHKEIDGVLSGVGFTGSLHHSVGSTVISDEGDEIPEYVINQNGWELGVHYRTPLHSLVTIDGGVFFGNQTYEIVDASPLFETPDTSYSILGAGGHLDLAITERALIGFGARYFTVLDTGDLASTEFFGPVNASGLGLAATFQIPLPARLYVRGQLAYQRIAIETIGGGFITDDEAITDGSDSLITGNVHLGIAF